MKKLILSILMTALCTFTYAQQRRNDLTPYLAGSVPVVNGYVQFESTYRLPNASQTTFMEQLKDQVQVTLVEGDDQLPQARITEYSPATGIIAASIEEYMFFKRTNWQIHRVRFYYQLLVQVSSDTLTLTMRNLHYKYDSDITSTTAFQEDRRAEQWITDEAALTKNGDRLQRISGKFRRFTIDRKDDIFSLLAQCVGAQAIH